MAFEAYKVQVDAPRDPEDGLKYGNFWDALDYEWDDTLTSILVAASAAHPVLVKEIAHVVTTAFTSTATVDVGDGTDPDHYIDTTDMAVDSVGNVTSSLNAASPHNGVWNTANFEIKVTVGGTVTGGAGKLLVNMLRF